MDVNMDRLNEFMGKMVGDIGAAANTALIRTGDRVRIELMPADRTRGRIVGKL